MSPLDCQTRLLAAVAIAHEAGKLARRRFLDRDGVAFSFKSHQDYLTETDGEVERLIAGRLAAAFPDDGMIGEEGGGKPAAATWIVDPIDGTSNFARGVPHFCISIGLLVDGEPEVGVIYDPMLDEMFAGRRGAGATLNGVPLKAAETDRLDRAVIEIGWSPRRPAQEYLDVVTRFFAVGASVKRGASGALGVAYVAAGRSDAYAERHINAWDVLAGLVLVREAGGRVNDFFAGDGLASGNPILVSAPRIAEAVSDIVGIPLR